jgi:DNA-binding PadR family transcriptional regulator
MRKPEFIDMKGLLSFHVMWLLKQRRMCGEEIIKELGKRRSDTPSPGTLYPALNKLREEGLIQKERDDKKMMYGLTPKGIKDLEIAISYFKAVYGEILQKAGIHSHKILYTKKSQYGVPIVEEKELGIDFI